MAKALAAAESCSSVIPNILAKPTCNAGFTSPKKVDICPGTALAAAGSSKQWARSSASSFVLYGAFTVAKPSAGLICFTTIRCCHQARSRLGLFDTLSTTYRRQSARKIEKDPFPQYLNKE